MVSLEGMPSIDDAEHALLRDPATVAALRTVVDGTPDQLRETG